MRVRAVPLDELLDRENPEGLVGLWPGGPWFAGPSEEVERRICEIGELHECGRHGAPLIGAEDEACMHRMSQVVVHGVDTMTINPPTHVARAVFQTIGVKVKPVVKA